jgi:hypothetical protein
MNRTIVSHYLAMAGKPSPGYLSVRRSPKASHLPIMRLSCRDFDSWDGLLGHVSSAKRPSWDPRGECLAKRSFDGTVAIVKDEGTCSLACMTARIGLIPSLAVPTVTCSSSTQRHKSNGLSRCSFGTWPEPSATCWRFVFRMAARLLAPPRGPIVEPTGSRSASALERL